MSSCHHRRLTGSPAGYPSQQRFYNFPSVVLGPFSLSDVLSLSLSLSLLPFSLSVQSRFILAELLAPSETFVSRSQTFNLKQSPVTQDHNRFFFLSSLCSFFMFNAKSDSITFSYFSGHRRLNFCVFSITRGVLVSRTERKFVGSLLHFLLRLHLWRLAASSLLSRRSIADGTMTRLISLPAREHLFNEPSFTACFYAASTIQLPRSIVAKRSREPISFPREDPFIEAFVIAVDRFGFFFLSGCSLTAEVTRCSWWESGKRLFDGHNLHDSSGGSFWSKSPGRDSGRERCGGDRTVAAETLCGGCLLIRYVEARRRESRVLARCPNYLPSRVLTALASSLFSSAREERGFTRERFFASLRNTEGRDRYRERVALAPARD